MADNTGKYFGSTALAELWSLIKSKLEGKADADDLEKKADKTTTLSGYGITDAYTRDEVDAKLVSAMHYKGSVATYDDLPTEGNELGDIYNCTDTGTNYAWDGEGWDELGSIVDLSDYATKEDLDAKADASDTYTKEEVDDMIATATSGGLTGVTFDGVAATITGTTAAISFDIGDYMVEMTAEEVDLICT